MKLELNFMENRDGNPCVVISSPMVKNGVIAEIDYENYDTIVNTLADEEASEESLKEIVEMLAADISEENPKEILNLSVWKKKHDNGSKTYGMLASIPDGTGGISSGTTIDISNKDYKKFCKGSTMQKINIAYNVFEENIKSGIFDN